MARWSRLNLKKLRKSATNTAQLTIYKLNRDDLKPGQKAALVIRLYYEEERRKAKERMLSGKSADPTETFQEGVGESAAIDQTSVQIWIKVEERQTREKDELSRFGGTGG